MKKIKPSFWYPISWLALSTFLLTIPGRAFPKENWLEKIWFDKWVHIGLFAVLVILGCWAMLRWQVEKPRLTRFFILMAIGALAYGTGMEFVQKHLVANRSFDIGDIAANGIGAGAGLLYSLRRYIKK